MLVFAYANITHVFFARKVCGLIVGTPNITNIHGRWIGLGIVSSGRHLRITKIVISNLGIGAETTQKL